MKGVFLQKNLIEGINKVAHLASSEKGSLPILGYILIRVEKGLLYLTSTNLEVAIETYIRGKTEINGVFTIPANLFSSHLSFLPNDSITLELKNQELYLKHKNGETKIKGLPADDFPLIPKLEKKNGIKLNTQNFKKSLQQVVVACSSSEARPEISGVLFSGNGKKIFLVGTDSYRLAEKSINIKEGVFNSKIIVPLKTCHELIRILDDQDDVELFFSESQVLFSQGTTTLISRVVQAEFPNYQELIPKNFKTKILVNKEELIRAIKGASPFSRAGVNDVSLEFLPDKGKIFISSLNNAVGEVRLEVEAEVIGEKNSLSFNYRYFLEGLSSVSENEISIEIIDDGSPTVIKSVNRDDFLYLLMPIKA